MKAGRERKVQGLGTKRYGDREDMKPGYGIEGRRFVKIRVSWKK